MRTRNGFALILLFLLMFSGCKIYEPVTKRQNLAYLYRPGATSLHPRFIVYHNSDSTSNLMVKVYPTELLFNKANEDGNYKAWLSIQYRAREVGGSRALTDSAILEFPFDVSGLDKPFITNISLKTKAPIEYIVEVVTMDRLRKRAVQSFIFIDRTSEINSQNYFVMDQSTGSLLFNPVVDSSMIFNIYFPKRTVDTLFTHYYKPDTRIPYPPNLLLSTSLTLDRADSTWQIGVFKSKGIQLSEKGIYQFLKDANDKQGYNMYYFGEYFPLVKTPEQMIDPLVYLADDKEMRELRKNESAKIAVDNFWLEAGKDINRAKELIRIYYNRVFYSNYYFTSFKEGWSTDRGMIYLIYGSPGTLYKTATQERWIYGKEDSDKSIEFVFTKVNHPLSNNVFRLRRSADLNSRWVQAVRAWRQGSVFILEND
ncbi:MAG: GWxTD domain-containing protein [Bacteroidota bacterium]|nr:GWxTD domain-containing protein [Bacteroidota bacterium]